MSKTLIIIPTYNEIENIRTIIPAVLDSCPDSHILVVDDSSPDGTGKAVKDLQNTWNQSLFLLERKGKGGLAGAYISGFKWALERTYEYICEFDADFSHDPKYLPEMLRMLDSDLADVVIGSRYTKGGGVKGWSRMRYLISTGGSLYSRTVLRCPIRDMTGGFNFWSRKVLEALPLDRLISTGYSFQIELKIRSHRRGFRIHEYPIIFRDREAGTSKMSGGIFLEALSNVWALRKVDA